MALGKRKEEQDKIQMVVGGHSPNKKRKEPLRTEAEWNKFHHYMERGRATAKKLKVDTLSTNNTNFGGKKQTVAFMVSPEKSSARASKRTLRTRTQKLNNVEKAAVAPAGASEEEVKDSLTIQRAHRMKQDSTGYLRAAAKAGLSIRGKFTVDVSLEMQATLNWSTNEYERTHSFLLSKGINLLASTSKVRKLNRDMQSDFEVGTTEKLSDGSYRAYVRITDLESHLRDHLHAMWVNGTLHWPANIALDTVIFLLLIDKGGDSTKLYCVPWNSAETHSYRTSTLLAEFEGGEDLEAINVVFGDIFQQVSKMEVDGISWKFCNNELARLTTETMLWSGSFLTVKEQRTLLEVSHWFHSFDKEVQRQADVERKWKLRPEPKCADGEDDSNDVDENRLWSGGIARYRTAPPPVGKVFNEGRKQRRANLRKALRPFQAARQEISFDFGAVRAVVASPLPAAFEAALALRRQTLHCRVCEFEFETRKALFAHLRSTLECGGDLYEPEEPNPAKHPCRWGVRCRADCCLSHRCRFGVKCRIRNCWFSHPDTLPPDLSQCPYGTSCRFKSNNVVCRFLHDENVDGASSANDPVRKKPYDGELPPLPPLSASAKAWLANDTGIPIRGFPAAHGKPLNTVNVKVSLACPRCRRGNRAGYKPECLRPATLLEHTITKIMFHIGGDTQFLQPATGLTKNGKHFCYGCTVTHHKGKTIKGFDLAPGVPHGPVTLDRYKQYDSDLRQKDHPVRTRALAEQKYAEYTAELKAHEASGKKSKFKNAAKHLNQIGLPIFAGEIEHKIGAPNLHIDLGQVKGILEYLEGFARLLDSQVFQFLGRDQPIRTPTEKEEAVQLQFDEARLSVQQAWAAGERAKTNFSAWCGDQDSIRFQHFGWAPNDVRLSDSDRAIRLHGLELFAAQQQTATALGKALDVLKPMHVAMQKSRKAKLLLAGPFERLLQWVLDLINLQRQCYHGRALVGNDCAKLMKWWVRALLSRVFRPWKFTNRDGEERYFPSPPDASTVVPPTPKDEEEMKDDEADSNPTSSRFDRWHSDQVWTLLSKYAQCRSLHAVSRMLCRHEVALLRIRGISYGNWAPCVLLARYFHADFPTTPKFHFAVVETARFAEKHYTVGMAGEHVVEVAHARFNQYRRTFCSVQNKPDRMGHCARASWNASNPHFQKPRKTVLVSSLSASGQ
jgi:hypothetical protein